MTHKEKLVRNVFANVAIGLVVLAVLAFSLSSEVINTNAGKNDPIYKGSSANKVSLMVNVYWGTEYLDPMLKIFEENGVHTTFFVGGMWVAENNDMLKKIYDAGHEIGNHGYYHKDHKKLNAERNHEEMNVTHLLVKDVLGIDMKLFAPPSGSFSKTTISEAEKMGYETIMWTHDTIDWRDHDAEKIYSRATKKLAGGDLVLMHPTADTVKALDRILKEVAAKGLTVAPVSKVITTETFSSL